MTSSRSKIKSQESSASSLSMAVQHPSMGEWRRTGEKLEESRDALERALCGRRGGRSLNPQPPCSSTDCGSGTRRPSVGSRPGWDSTPMTGEAGGGDATGPSMARVGGGTRTPDSTDRSRRVVRSGRSKGRVTGGTCVAEPRRRQAGEGSISEYATKAGPRFLIKFTVQREDGTKRVVLKRGFGTRKDAAAALRKQIGKIETGE